MHVFDRRVPLTMHTLPKIYSKTVPKNLTKIQHTCLTLTYTVYTTQLCDYRVVSRFVAKLHIDPTQIRSFLL